MPKINQIIKTFFSMVFLLIGLMMPAFAVYTVGNLSTIYRGRQSEGEQVLGVNSGLSVKSIEADKIFMSSNSNNISENTVLYKLIANKRNLGIYKNRMEIKSARYPDILNVWLDRSSDYANSKIILIKGDEEFVLYEDGNYYVVNINIIKDTELEVAILDDGSVNYSQEIRLYIKSVL